MFSAQSPVPANEIAEQIKTLVLFQRLKILELNFLFNNFCLSIYMGHSELLTAKIIERLLIKL
jgi:hypothetical protein